MKNVTSNFIKLPCSIFKIVRGLRTSSMEVIDYLYDMTIDGINYEFANEREFKIWTTSARIINDITSFLDLYTW